MLLRDRVGLRLAPAAHIAPVPPGTPYEQQQYHALMAENGIIPQTAEQVATLGAAIRAALSG